MIDRRWRIPALSIGTLVTALSCVFGMAQESSEDAAGAYGLEQRVPWTSSHVQGRPEPPPPYRPERVYSKLRFKTTTLLDVLPGTGQLLVGEMTGKVFLLPKDPNAEQAELFLDCRQLVERLNREAKPPLTFSALYGMAFDPDFVRNRYCYMFYVVGSSDPTVSQLPEGTRVSRLRVSPSEPWTCDIESEELVISWLQGGHNGGCLRFGPDGCLYISTGDGGFAFPPDGRKSGQDLSTLLSKILRIDVHRPENGRPYAIPADNPFVELEGARGETWAYGLRNPWKMSFDRHTGDLWVGDVGWELWELVYRVNRGDNFGWSIVEGRQPVHAEGQRGPTPIVPATMEIPHTDGASITGGFVYRGRQFPELVGHYVFGDWETRRIWGAKITDDNKLAEKFELIDPTVRIVDFAEAPDGELYLLDHEDGSIFTLAKNIVPADAPRFPRLLSESGIFQSVARHQPAQGVLPFSINAEQWSDGATAERLIAVPGRESIRLRPKPRVVPGSQFSRAVDYPLNTVACKTLSLEMVQGDPASRRRMETQLLHFDGREWQGYTYEWNDEQTDAALVERAGKNKVLHIQDADAPGDKKTFTWRFAARAECIRCHNPWSEYTLAFNVAQLNRTHDFGTATDNQLRTYRHIGLLSDITDEIDPDEPPGTSEPPRSPDQLPRLTPPFDEPGDLNARARSYLHANCGHCHRFNGGGSSYIYLQHDLPLPDTKTIGSRPTQGTFGIHEAQILTPGDPYRSVLYFRLSKIGPGHMPHLGSKLTDERGLKLVHDWIRQLPVRLEDSVKIDRLIAADESLALPKEAQERPRAVWQAARRLAQGAQREMPNADDLMQAAGQVSEREAKAVTQRAEDRVKWTGELLSTPPRAVMLADAARQDRLPAEIRRLVLATALAPTADPAIRDLFENFVPEEQRTQRLGESIDPTEILKLSGELARGRQLFHESTVVQCRNCHRVGGKGIELGPDLDAIGKKYDRAKLLESILQPSLQIEPKFKMWLVETKDGQVLTGLLVSRTDSEIILRDVQNKPHRFATSEVEGIFPQTKSLMPELLVRDFTAQQLADLLTYLESLRGEEKTTPNPKSSSK